MKILQLLVLIVVGAAVAWLSVVAAIWFLAPIFLIGAGVVCVALDKTARWRVAAFSVGMIAVLTLYTRDLVRDIGDKQQRAELRLHEEKKSKAR